MSLVEGAHSLETLLELSRNEVSLLGFEQLSWHSHVCSLLTRFHHTGCSTLVGTAYILTAEKLLVVNVHRVK